MAGSTPNPIPKDFTSELGDMELPQVDLMTPHHLPLLYSKHKEGGRGLGSIRTIIQDETSELQEHIREKVPRDEALSECLRQWKLEIKEPGGSIMGGKTPAWNVPLTDS